jgi:hypothetical protein
VDLRHVDPGGLPLLVGDLLSAFDRLRVAAADRDVTGGVLVEQAVLEEQIALTDS